jgi:hypothetical protein
MASPTSLQMLVSCKQESVIENAGMQFNSSPTKMQIRSTGDRIADGPPIHHK